MQIQELLRLVKWFKENIVEANIPTQYQGLHNKMSRNAKGGNQAQRPFETERENLFKALKTVNTNLLTLEQIEFLEKLNVIEVIGSIGIQNIESILYENQLDIATAAKKIGDFSNRIHKAQEQLTEIENTLSKSFSIEDDTHLPEGSVMMRVYFRDGSAINNIKDFKKFGALWHDIGRGIAMAQSKSPEDFNIVGAQKGSIIIEMVVLAALATSVSTILLSGLKVAERVIDILKKAEELKKLKLSNRKIEKELKKEAETEKENGIQTILENAIEQLGLNPKQDGDKIAALKRSVTKLVDFTQNGGAVDFIEPDGQEIDEDQEEKENDLRIELSKLKENVEEIRSIENKIKLLEGKAG